jgi:tRNA A37 methylthiotransferase MiaB
MPNQVPVRVARERNRILREIAQEKKRHFMYSFVGRTVDAITLGPGGSDHHGEIFTEALTDNYLKLHLKGHHAANCWIEAQVNEAEADSLIGEPI